MPELLRRFANWTKQAAAAPAAPTSPEPVTTSRERNLFDAAAAYVTACIADDQDLIDNAARRVAPDALMFGVTELAQRAVLILARQRGVAPQQMARALLGLPAA